jgi:hypothetical protein
LAYLVPFFRIEPDLAAKETRTLTLFHPRDGIPAGQYGLIESYCPDPDCDCRRVMLNVFEESRPGRLLAPISYGFDRDADDVGPYLDPLSEQCSYADALLRLVQEVVLRDPRYVARLERHDRLVKRAARDPAHPAYDRLRQAAESDGGWRSVRQMDALLGNVDPGPPTRSRRPQRSLPLR